MDPILRQKVQSLFPDSILYQDAASLVTEYNLKRSDKTRINVIEDGLLVLNDLRAVNGEIKKIIHDYDSGLLKVLEFFGLVDNYYKGVKTDATVIRVSPETVDIAYVLGNIPHADIIEHNLMKSDMGALRGYENNTGFLIPENEIKDLDGYSWVKPKVKATA
ncbi:MAG: hypothetical protein KAJ20_00275 [Candidatus Aenigmarchaeota archaeon]|nr:hypothetical protein [Candidatus Aenigmarchaeota archaeon]MCK5372754.1 hypothetical protein [Candidatus Aenigmarchaeota archaeon]MCK5452113.1 hypothetical protein [Candidatus Aenigmarchaeota archaeon]